MVDPSPRPSPPAGEVIRFPDRRAEIAAAARKPPLTPRGKLYVVLGLLCLVPSILWFLSALTQEVMAGPADRLVDFGFTALSMVGLPVLLGWVLLALGLRQRVYDED